MIRERFYFYITNIFKNLALKKKQNVFIHIFEQILFEEKARVNGDELLFFFLLIFLFVIKSRKVKTKENPKKI